MCSCLNQIAGLWLPIPHSHGLPTMQGPHTPGLKNEMGCGGVCSLWLWKGALGVSVSEHLPSLSLALGSP